MNKFIDLTGQIFGKLTVSRHVGKNKWRHALFECECSCLNKTIITIDSNSLRRGRTKSCGCLQRETIARNNRLRAVHGANRNGRRTKEYICWKSIKNRCYNSNGKYYKNYGGRGIIVCDRWRDSFENFLEDMGKAPGKEYSIDRINNNGNYKPGNCRWATQEEQSSNKRTNIMIGDKTLTQVCRDQDLPYETIRKRIKQGWLIKDALNTPIRKSKKKRD